MIDYRRLYHTCMLVPDLEAAMQAIGAPTGILWSEPWTYENLRYWTPQGFVVTPRIRVTYSKLGPQHVELIEPAAGGYFELARERCMHHVGIWSSDVGAETKALVDEGWTVRAAAVSPQEGYGRVSFVEPPGGGLLLELVTTGLEPLMRSRVGPTLSFTEGKT